ncbi:MAG: phosphotransferase [Planctomycetota bacterium]
MDAFEEAVKQITGARSVELGEQIQSLWSGYGCIQRARVSGAETENVVIKHVDLSRARSNRRGWGGEQSHRRKVRSYQVETKFYQSYSAQSDPSWRIPKLVATYEKPEESGWIMVLEDLDAAGFSERRSELAAEDIQACLRWLANFHATFIGTDAAGLWPVGTYWHLATRPEELEAMPAGPLKQLASQIDRRLNEAEFQTLVHGDAKVANFCFSNGSARGIPPQVAAVDFQYVGRGCGMKDVAYFISSCLSEGEAAAEQESLLSFYFRVLEDALADRGSAVEFARLEKEWRELYPFAWADFCRFLIGWSPGHWKLNAYSTEMTQRVVQELG